jgi:Type I phosphodiesterase / nucleotide pyrophosphatase
MNTQNRILKTTIALGMGIHAVNSLVALPANAMPRSPIKHVLLISIDGMHGEDLTRYLGSHPNSTLAQLSHRGVTYLQAFAPRPSDSFPGLLALVTGGTPKSTGVYYDNSYDRKLSPPGSKCATIGTEVVFDESIDINPDLLDGGGGIDPAKLPLDPSKGCTPLYPHAYLRVNTIFEVIKAAGGYTAWADKHPAYDLVNGPSGKGVDDLYTPEINNANSPTAAVKTTEAYDDLKVTAVLNQINGKTAAGKPSKVPTILGMNFQAVSVGQKLPGNGYVDAAATPSAGLQDAIDHTDRSLGKLVAQLRSQGLYNSTLIIVSAKHGQSPIDPSKLKKLGSVLNLVPGLKADLFAHATEDDVALLWLNDQKRTTEVVTAFNANTTAAGIQTLYSSTSLTQLFADPLKDSRTPDIVIQPIPGVIYTSSTKKIAEHGGFAKDDTHVALLVANPYLKPAQFSRMVRTTQVAPTILQALGLNPRALQAVKQEKTPTLPELELNDRDRR